MYDTIGVMVCQDTLFVTTLFVAFCFTIIMVVEYISINCWEDRKNGSITSFRNTYRKRTITVLAMQTSGHALCQFQKNDRKQH